MIYEDQLAAIERRFEDARHHRRRDFDLALLTDGLKAEREQGITIDVAYRYFSTAKRKFIIADCPGHEQYTRNMATGASTCDLAIILIDARHGVMTQTKRHSFIVSLLGIKHVVVAINKMDLVGYSEEVFEKIKADYREFATRLDMVDLHFIPISALKGDNVVDHSENMPWYDGSTLMHHLENVHIASDRNLIDFRYPVQFVNRPNLDFRGFCGTIASGGIRKGETVMSLPSRKTSRVKSIVTLDGELDEAFAPMSVTLTLEDEIDVSRGDMLVRPDNVPTIADAFEAMIVWMADEALMPGKQYFIKQTTKLVAGSISAIRYHIDVNTLHRQETEKLTLNEIGRCQVRLNQPIAFDSYRGNHGTGSFIVIDRMTNVTVGAGMILQRSAAATTDHWDDEADQHLQAERSNVTGRTSWPLRSTAGHVAVHRPHRFRQIDDRLRPRTPPVRHGACGDRARRSEHAARHQPRPRLHRRRTQRKPPPQGRSGQADERSGSDLPRRVSRPAGRGPPEGRRSRRPPEVLRRPPRRAARSLPPARSGRPLRGSRRRRHRQLPRRERPYEPPCHRTSCSTRPRSTSTNASNE